MEAAHSIPDSKLFLYDLHLTIQQTYEIFKFGTNFRNTTSFYSAYDDKAYNSIYSNEF